MVLVLPLMTEVFNVYSTIPSFTLHLEVDWILCSKFDAAMWSGVQKQPLKIIFISSTEGGGYIDRLCCWEGWKVFENLACLSVNKSR